MNTLVNYKISEKFLKIIIIIILKRNSSLKATKVMKTYLRYLNSKNICTVGIIKHLVETFSIGIL